MSYIGQQLKNNMMNGLPTRTKSYSDYIGAAIPPCGDFEQLEHSNGSSMPPWLKNAAVNYFNPPSLHDEMKLFMEYITPSRREVEARKDAVERFTALIESLNPSVAVVPFGSYVTGLNFPTSDIDMVLKPRVGYSYFIGELTLRKLYYKLLRSDFASEIQNILQASVPLIRVTDKKTGLDIDLTASTTHSFKSTQAAQRWLEHDGDITRTLVFVVKTFLFVRRCGTTYTGGINSYLLLWMVVAWVNIEWPKVKDLQQFDQTASVSSPLAPQSTTSLRPDFGDALKGFLKFYGSEFDYERSTIKIEPRPQYISKRYKTQRFSLSILDPADPSIDMGAKAYGIKHVKESFKEAYDVLSQNTSIVGPKGLLGVMIGGDFTKYIQKRNDLTAET